MSEAQAKELFISRLDKTFRVENLLSSDGKSAHLTQARRDALLSDIVTGCKDISFMDASQRDELIQEARNDTDDDWPLSRRVEVATALFDMCTNEDFKKNHAKELNLPAIEGEEQAEFGVGD